MIAPLDVRGLLRHLDRAEVRYVLIGGVAVNVHGVIRATKDLDICPDPSFDNLQRLAGAIRELGAAQVGMEDFDATELPFDPARAEELALGGNFRLATDLGSLDIMQWVSGVEGEQAYPVLAADAFTVEMEGMQIIVCSLAHLRAMKRAAGRPRDLQDLADLAIAHGDDPAA